MTHKPNIFYVFSFVAISSHKFCEIINEGLNNIFGNNSNEKQSLGSYFNKPFITFKDFIRITSFSSKLSIDFSLELQLSAGRFNRIEHRNHIEINVLSVVPPLYINIKQNINTSDSLKDFLIAITVLKAKLNTKCYQLFESSVKVV